MHPAASRIETPGFVNALGEPGVVGLDADVAQRARIERQQRALGGTGSPRRLVVTCCGDDMAPEGGELFH